MPTASAGFFPLDEQLHTVDAGWSEQVAKWAVWLCGKVEDDFAEQVLQQIGGLAISDTSIWRRVQVWGEKFKAVAEAQSIGATTPPPRSEIQRGVVPTPQVMGVAMDGATVNIRQEGWKELKVGCVFEVALRPEWDPESEATVERAHAVHNSYVAYLGGPVAFGQRVWAEACARGIPQARESIVVGDGAAWIWNLAQEHWGGSLQVVDWYHGKEHLYKAAHLAYGEGSPQAMSWAKGQEKVLYQGRAWAVAQSLEILAEQHPTVAAALRSEAGYFRTNQRRMYYLELREQGFPIGSGMVESGCKQFRARFAGPGMRWSREGIERLIPVRAAILSEHFDEMWSSAYKLPLE